jgi:hypothetical protein
VAIVGGGLGQPEVGALVVRGMGRTGPSSGMSATLTGVAVIDASLTGGGTVTAAASTGHGHQITFPQPRIIQLRTIDMSADLVGFGRLIADISFGVNFDDDDLRTLLLVDAL